MSTIREDALGRLARTLACSVLLATQTMTAVAADPIPGVDVVVEKVPPGIAVARIRTNRYGCLPLKSLPKGRYEVYDTFGNRASLDHDGGKVNWRLLGSLTDKRPVWTLVDECDPP